MRKQDIKPGVVYAYQRSTSAYASPEPCVVLSLEMHSRPRRGDHPGWVRETGWTKPGRRSTFDPNVGYPAVVGGTPEALAALGPEVIASGLTTEQHESGMQMYTLTTLAHLRGPYAEAKERHRRETEGQRQRQREADARRQDRYDRSAAVIAILKAHGVFASWRGNIELTLENAEKLAALLPETPEGARQ